MPDRWTAPACQPRYVFPRHKGWQARGLRDGHGVYAIQSWLIGTTKLSTRWLTNTSKVPQTRLGEPEQQICLNAPWLCKIKHHCCRIHCTFTGCLLWRVRWWTRSIHSWPPQLWCADLDRPQEVPNLHRRRCPPLPHGPRRVASHLNMVNSRKK